MFINNYKDLVLINFSSAFQIKKERITYLMDYIIEKHFELNESMLRELHSIYSQLFDDAYPIENLRERSTNKIDYLVLIAKNESHTLGFKVGFAEDGLFHSWMGGVLKAYRKNGIARELTEIQHNWAKIKGYKEIRTHTDHRYNDMMIHNIRNGFKIVGTKIRAHNGVKKIIMIKKLSD